MTLPNYTTILHVIKNKFHQNTFCQVPKGQSILKVFGLFNNYLQKETSELARF